MRILLTIGLLIWMMEGVGQPPGRFYTAFGGDGDDIAYSVKQTVDRQYIIAGSSSSYFSHGGVDAYVVKIDSMGYPMWQRFVGGEGNDVARSIFQLKDSGYVVAGYSNSFGSNGYDAYVFRVDKNGGLLWERTFGGVDWDFGSDLVVIDTCIYTVGTTGSSGSGKKDGFLLKYSLNGNHLLTRYYGGTADDELKAIIVTRDTGLAMVGYTKSLGETNGDSFFIKTNLNGDTLLFKTFGGPYADHANDIVQKQDDFSYVICGAKTFSAGSPSHSHMYSIKEDGSFYWENSYYHSVDDEEFVSLANSFQLQYLTAYIKNIPVPNVSIQGNIFVGMTGGWNYKVNSFGGYADEYMYSIDGTLDGGYVIAGCTKSYGAAGWDIYILKDDSTCTNYVSVVGINEIHNIGDRFEVDYSRRLAFLHSETDLDHLIIIGIDGKIYLNDNLSGPDAEISYSGIIPGLYIIQYVDKNSRTRCIKFIIPPE